MPARGPRCRCGEPIEHVPGKVPRVYCSDRCRKAAKREIQRLLTAGGNPGHLGKESTEFPTPLRPAETRRGGKPGEPGSGDRPDSVRARASRSRKAGRYAGRRTLWRITSDKSCRGCGRAVMDAESGVILAQTAEGKSVVMGLLRCGKIWFCPVCSASIRHRRAEEITQAVVAWIQQGGTALLVTFTARHAASDELATLMDAIQGTRAASAEEIESARVEAVAARAEYAELAEATKAAVEAARLAAPKGSKRAAMAEARAEFAAPLREATRRLTAAELRRSQGKRKAGAYQRLITGGTWAGRPERGVSGIRDRVGYLGMIRATEVTVGLANGWHPHIHAIVLIGGRTTGKGKDRAIVGTFEPSASARKELEDHFRAVWTSHLHRLDRSFTPSDKHGVDFKPLETARDAEDLGKYIAKLQDGHKSVSPANELARGDLKKGRRGNQTPFQLLTRIGDLTGGVSEDDAPGEGSKEWCLTRWWEYEAAVRGRRAIEWTRHLRPLLGIEGGDTEKDDLDALFEGEDTSKFRAGVKITEKGWGKVTRRALDLAAIESAEGNEIDLDRIRKVITDAGGSRSAVQQMTPGEVEAAWESMLTAMASRRLAGTERRKAGVR